MNNPRHIRVLPVHEQDPLQITIGKWSVCMDLDETGNLQVRVYPQSTDGQWWDGPLETLDASLDEAQQINAENEEASHAV